MSGIPTSTSVRESAVIEAPFADVWHLIKLGDFAQFWTSLSKSELVNTSAEANVAKWTFKDGTQLEVKQEEHSVSMLLPLLAYQAPYNVPKLPTGDSNNGSHSL